MTPTAARLYASLELVTESRVREFEKIGSDGLVITIAVKYGRSSNNR